MVPVLATVRAVAELPVRLREDPVAAPMFGVTKVGEVAKTRAPEPVSSEITLASWAEVVGAKSPRLLESRAMVPEVSCRVRVLVVPGVMPESWNWACLVVLPSSCKVKLASRTVITLLLSRVLLERVSLPARVARVPLVGRVTLVAAVVVKVKALAPEVVKDEAVEMLPPRVIVLVLLFTPVPPLAGVKIPVTLVVARLTGLAVMTCPAMDR